MKPTINIQFEYTSGPYGGGNQFVKALKNFFIEKNVYEEDVSKAGIILFNSDHSLRSVLAAKRMFKDKIFVHRLAGPMYIPRGSSKAADLLVYKMNQHIADGTIFQSHWSRIENEKAGWRPGRFETIIMNAPDKKMFPPKISNQVLKGGKIKLIATSWSANIGKGFNIYKYLDENLDFKRFSFTFVGRSPFEFKNILHIPPQTTEELVKIILDHDIFISASRYEACSNSVIEAMHCGLPAIVYNDSSNPEIIGEGGTTFESEQNVIAAIENIAAKYEYYSHKVCPPSMDEVGDRYVRFCMQILDAHNSGEYTPKSINFIQYCLLSMALPDFILKRMGGILKSLLVSIYKAGRSGSV